MSFVCNTFPCAPSHCGFIPSFWLLFAAIHRHWQWQTNNAGSPWNEPFITHQPFLTIIKYCFLTSVNHWLLTVINLWLLTKPCFRYWPLTNELCLFTIWSINHCWLLNFAYYSLITNRSHCHYRLCTTIFSAWWMNYCPWGSGKRSVFHVTAAPVGPLSSPFGSSRIRNVAATCHQWDAQRANHPGQWTAIGVWVNNMVVYICLYIAIYIYTCKCIIAVYLLLIHRYAYVLV